MQIPKWLLEVNPNSYLSTKDVIGVFGYKTFSGLNWAIRKNEFPCADWSCDGKSKRVRNWRVSTIIAEIKRRNRMEACK